MKRSGLLLGIVFVALFACGKPISTKLERIAKDAPPPTTLALLQGLPDTIFIPAPLVRQARNFTCGASAFQSLLSFYGDNFTEGQLQRLLGSDRENGTSYRAMKLFVERVLNVAGAKEKALEIPACEEEAKKTSPGYLKDCVDGTATVLSRPELFLTNGNAPAAAKNELYSMALYPGLDTRPTTKPLSVADGEADVPADGFTVRELEAELRLGHPVLILLQAWPGNPAPGWEAGWENGHFVLVVGFDTRNFYYLDPSTTGSWTYTSRADLMRRWHDEDVQVVAGKPEKGFTKHFAMVLVRKRAFDFSAAVPKME